MLKIFFAAVLYVSTCTVYAAQVEFVDTQESKPLKINPALFDTTQAKQFLATGKNAYIGDQAGIASGKKYISFTHVPSATEVMFKAKQLLD